MRPMEAQKVDAFMRAVWGGGRGSWEGGWVGGGGHRREHGEERDEGRTACYGKGGDSGGRSCKRRGP